MVNRPKTSAAKASESANSLLQMFFDPISHSEGGALYLGSLPCHSHSDIGNICPVALHRTRR